MLVSFWMTQRLTREINILEKQMMDKQIELSNYQKYANMLGSSSIITAGNIAGLSSNLIPRASLFAQYSNQASTMSAMQNVQQLKMMGMIPMLQNPLMQQQYEISAFNQFKEQALKTLKQQETTILNEKEKEIQLEMNQLQMKLKEKQALLETYKEHANKRVEDFVPQFS